ncbi:MAG TPA: imidazolonepropionase, partial [Flavobacteriales bacterium]|nr:imidazolonepropionase [Flavobacteriales bacterium]
MRILIKNIKEIVQIAEPSRTILSGSAMSSLPSLNNAWLTINDDLIEDFGSMDEWNGVDDWTNLEVIDAADKLVLPCWCDSHTHLVFSGSRETEFVDRINGLSYEEIANKGGGILNSAKRLSRTSEEELFEQALARMKEISLQGTGAVEIKSGYGLSVDSELKILRVIKKLKSESPLSIKATFLGAHAIPTNYKDKRQDYIDLIIEEMLPQIKDENLADYIDVFCETNYFTVEEMSQVLEAGALIGLKPKVHVNQFTSLGGIQEAIKQKAISVDHLEVMEEADFKAVVSSDIIPTLLPSCSFFLKIPYAPAKELIKRGAPVALATDYNPGSTPSGNIPFVISLACIKMGLTPEQAINAVTINGAAAMELNEAH